MFWNRQICRLSWWNSYLKRQSWKRPNFRVLVDVWECNAWLQKNTVDRSHGNLLHMRLRHQTWESLVERMWTLTLESCSIMRWMINWRLFCRWDPACRHRLDHLCRQSLRAFSNKRNTHSSFLTCERHPSTRQQSLESDPWALTISCCNVNKNDEIDWLVQRQPIN